MIVVAPATAVYRCVVNMKYYRSCILFRVQVGRKTGVEAFHGALGAHSAHDDDAILCVLLRAISHPAEACCCDGSCEFGCTGCQSIAEQAADLLCDWFADADVASTGGKKQGESPSAPGSGATVENASQTHIEASDEGQQPGAPDRKSVV